MNVGCDGRETPGTQEEVEHLNEKQEVLATLMEGKMSMQKVAPEKVSGENFRGVEDLRSIGTCTTQSTSW